MKFFLILTVVFYLLVLTKADTTVPFHTCNSNIGQIDSLTVSSNWPPHPGDDESAYASFTVNRNISSSDNYLVRTDIDSCSVHYSVRVDFPCVLGYCPPSISKDFDLDLDCNVFSGVRKNVLLCSDGELHIKCPMAAGEQQSLHIGPYHLDSSYLSTLIDRLPGGRLPGCHINVNLSLRIYDKDNNVQGCWSLPVSFDCS